MQPGAARLDPMAADDLPPPHIRHTRRGTLIHSADRRLRLQVQAWHDDRGPPTESLTLWCRPAAGAQPLLRACWTSHGLGSSVRFTGPDTLVVEHQVDRRGTVWRLMIDTQAGTFSPHPHERPMPLDELDRWLSPPHPPGRALPTPALTPGRRAARIFIELISLLGAGVLAGGGAWMALAADTAQDRLTGLFGLVFFGICAALALRDLLSLRTAATAPPR